MDILVVIGQRNEDHPGQYAPKALAVACGSDSAENLDYIQVELAKALIESEFENAALLIFNIDGLELKQKLSQQTGGVLEFRLSRDPDHPRTLIERVAKAMAKQSGWLNWDTAKTVADTPNGNEPDEEREYWRDLARVALDASAPGLVRGAAASDRRAHAS